MALQANSLLNVPMVAPWRSRNPIENSPFAYLPKAKWWGFIDLYQWEGYWYSLPRLEAALAMQHHFKALNSDVILASSIKTGTTWLKALIPSIISHNTNQDPLLTNHPNALIPSLELKIYGENPAPNLSEMASPLLFRTHLPYTVLPESIKSSKCRIVYVTRNPRDTFVSLWHFMDTTRSAEQRPFPIEEALRGFCDGEYAFGPFFDHVLGYWKESLQRPEKILFLKYEQMKEDPKGQLRRLAEFLGRPFEKEEDVDTVVWRCSLERLKSLEVNKDGVDPWEGMAQNAYFRRGIVGDWENHLTAEMVQLIDETTCRKLEGSGLSFQM